MIGSYDAERCSAGQLRSTSALVAVIPAFWLPQLDLVAVRIHDPGELAVLVRFRALPDFDAGCFQLGNHAGHVVDAVVDHERRGAGPEPVAVLRRDMPDGNAVVIGLVILPVEYAAAEILKADAEVPLVPRRQLARIPPGLEKHTAYTGYFCHRAAPAGPPYVF